MKGITRACAFIAVGSFSTIAAAFTTSFPFLNIMLNPLDSVSSAYSFRDSSGNTHPLIFCYPNSGGNANTGVATLTWPYKGTTQSLTMPYEGTIKINANYAGYFADFSGTLTITNISNSQLFVNCQYGF